MSWRVARSLDRLLAQVNAAYPGRDRRSDGAIGDVAHASTVSDHNPDLGGVVRARDFTDDDLAPGMDANALAEKLRASRDPRIKYVISAGKIFGGRLGPSPWVWRTYRGSNPHTSYVHVSVLGTAAADTTTPWKLTPTATRVSRAAVRSAPTGRVTVRFGSTGRNVVYLQEFLALVPDGVFGKLTLAAVKRYQNKVGLTADGVVGPVTWRHILAAAAR